jgi:hypothetical protein
MQVINTARGKASDFNIMIARFPMHKMAAQCETNKRRSRSRQPPDMNMNNLESRNPGSIRTIVHRVKSSKFMTIPSAVERLGNHG